MQACPQCHEVDLPPRSRYCLRCGALLTEAEHAGDLAHVVADACYTPPHLEREVLRSRSALEGERKDVSILFADVAGSLAMAEALDPEDVHWIMDEFFGRALEAVHAHQGTINQFRGDGFMALFGAPLARGREAERALRAALAIQDLTRRFSKSVEARFGLPLLLRIGVHSGTVWVGSIGSDLRRDYTAEGSTVGLAARLEREAAVGQILASEETMRRARHYFEFRDLGERRFHGVERSVRVFEVVGAGPFEERLQAEEILGLTPFVGRAAELAWLDRVVSSRAVSAPYLIEIQAEAGTGKSRLALEHLRRRDPAVALLKARCREADANRAYAPLVGLLRRWPRDLPGRKESETLLARLLGEPDLDALTRDQAARALGELLERACSEKPIALLVEDAHWIDPSTRELLQRLCSSPRPRGLAVLATTRSELGPVFSGALPVERLELGPLAPTEAEAIARAILGHLDRCSPLVELAVHRGGGNPLFIEEVARALRDGPEELRSAARLEVALRNAPTRVPETLRGTIAARIDALPDEEKRLLQAASAIGIPFARSLLCEVAKQQPETLDPLVDDLLQRGLLTLREAGELEFQHVLVREVGYQQLLLAHRRELHRNCAEAFEGRGMASSPDGASRIGAHFDAARDSQRAAAYLARAGSAYVKLHAAPEAVTHLQRAWELYTGEVADDASARVAVGLALVSALHTLDRSHESAAVLEALQHEDLESAERRRLAQVLIEGGWVQFSEHSRVESARRQIERGLALIGDDPDAQRLASAAHAYLSRIYAQDGDVRRSAEWAQLMTEFGERAGDRFLRIYGLASQGCALCDAGELASAARLCREAAALADAGDNEVAVAIAWGWLAKLLVFAGEPAEALAAAERARGAGERTRQVGAVYAAAAWAGQAYLLLGERECAHREFEEAFRINPRWPSSLDLRARGHLAIGRLDDAAETAHECLALEPPRLIRVRALCTLGRALGLSDPSGTEDAEGFVRASRALAAKLGLVPHEAEATRALGELALARGEREAGQSLLAAAAAAFERCGMPLHARQAREVV